MTTKGLTVIVDLDDLVTGHRSYDEDGDPTGEPVTVLDLIIREAATQVAERVVKDDHYKTLRQRVNEERDRLVAERVEAQIDEVLTRAVQPTDLYGQPKGEPSTLTEIVTKRAEKYLTEAVHEYNRPAMTRVEKFIDGAVDRVVKKELSEALTDARAQVKAAVEAKGAEVLAETIQRMAGGRS